MFRTAINLPLVGDAVDRNNLLIIKKRNFIFKNSEFFHK